MEVALFRASFPNVSLDAIIAQKVRDRTPVGEPGVRDKDYEWDKVEEEENWDPDFEEFDIPKSKAKKSGGKKGADDDDDFKLDEEFKDMDLFNERGFDDDDEDDF